MNAPKLPKKTISIEKKLKGANIFDKNPAIAKLELQAMEIAARVKKEGIRG